MEKTMEQLTKEERNAYFREWRAQNREKVKKHNADYWKRKAEKKFKEQGGK